jgi:hypothetical protein
MEIFNGELDERSLRSKRHRHLLPENRRIQAPSGSTPWIDRKRTCWSPLARALEAEFDVVMPTPEGTLIRISDNLGKT